MPRLLSAVLFLLLLACGDAAVPDAAPDAATPSDAAPPPAQDAAPPPSSSSEDAAPPTSDGAARPDAAPDAGACAPSAAVLAGSPGTFSNQCLHVDGEDRAFFLHAPANARALLVDFHGTGFPVADGTPPEELWATDGLEKAADAEGFVVVRPRSLSFVDSDGQTLYHWDANPGDLAKNAAYARALVDFLAAHYPIDRARVYASGFSNGTNMVAQLVGGTTFHGYGFMGGGIWATYDPGRLDAAPFRIYSTTGYQDQLRPESLDLYDWLGAHAFPAASLWVRETNAGHHIYGWQFAEMFGWLDRAARPAAGTLKNGWIAEKVPSPSESLLRLARGTSPGEVLAAGTSASVWSRAASGGWTLAASLAPSVALDGICTTTSGATIATGDGAVVVRSAPGAAWTVSLTAGVSPDDREDRLERLACVSGSTLVGAGPSYARASKDLGATWAPADIAIFGTTPSVTDIERGPSDTWIAVGALYIGRSADGTSFAPSTDPSSATWLYGVAAAPGGKWWAVGEAGTLLASTDDGASWTSSSVPTAEDLYAVSFWDASRGIAVGLHGAAFLTVDGGTTWSDVSTGLDAMNSDVTWLDRSTVLVVGGAGTALRRSVE